MGSMLGARVREGVNKVVVYAYLRGLTVSIIAGWCRVRVSVIIGGWCTFEFYVIVFIVRCILHLKLTKYTNRNEFN